MPTPGWRHCNRTGRNDKEGLLAVQEALPLLPLLAAAALLTPLPDHVDAAGEGGEEHAREDEEDQGAHRAILS